MKLLKTLLVSSIVAMASTAAFADTLTFEGLVGYDPNVSHYGDLTWNNFYLLDSSSTSLSNSGYHNGTVSGTQVAYNAFGNAASFGSTSAFTFNSGFFTGAWNDGLQIHVVGTGATAYSKDFVVNTASPSLVVFNWTGLTSVTFSTSGGTPHGYSGIGKHFALENITVNEAVTAVPEPESYAMLLAGLAAMGVVVRRRKAKLA